MTNKSDCFEMARALGLGVLNTEEYARLTTATAVFNGSEEAQNKLNEYYNLRQNGENKDNGALERMAAELQSNPEIGPMIDAQNDFNTLVNTVMEILRVTITGEMVSNSCGQGCGACGGCEG